MGLIKTLRHENYLISNSAVFKFGKLGDARAVEPLINMLATAPRVPAMLPMRWVI
jgi:HEAT repeat protein